MIQLPFETLFTVVRCSLHYLTSWRDEVIDENEFRCKVEDTSKHGSKITELDVPFDAFDSFTPAREQEEPCAEPDAEPCAEPDSEEQLSTFPTQQSQRWGPMTAIGMASVLLGLLVIFTFLTLGAPITPSAPAAPTSVPPVPVPEVIVPSCGDGAACEAVVLSQETTAANASDAQEAVQDEEEDEVQDSMSSSTYDVKLTRHSFPASKVGDIVYYRSAYFGTVHVGEPAVPFKVVFDTGSGHLILPSTYCQSETCKAHRRYRRGDSSTARDIDYDGTQVMPGQPRDQITVSFGTGEVTGEFVQETVCLGEKSLTRPSDDLAAKNESSYPELQEVDCVQLRVVLANEMTQEPFQSFAFDGVLGLGLQGLALAPEFNFFGQMAKAGRIREPVFGVFLADSDDEESEISIGGISPQHISGNLTWAPVAMPELGYWQLRIKTMKIGGEIVNYCNGIQADCRAVVIACTIAHAISALTCSAIRIWATHSAPHRHCSRTKTCIGCCKTNTVQHQADSK